MLFEELDGLEARGVDTSKLLVSANAHVIPSYNRTIDKVTERFLGKRRIGTTGRGIGPTYADKMNRVGIRIQDLYDEGILRQKVEAALELKNQLLAKIYNTRGAAVDEVVEELLSYAARLAPMVADTSLVLSQALDRGDTVLFEAGQATLLDVDHGTYPYVTSSNAVSAGACTGSGVPPTRIDSVIAILKAYTTRVGEGPFPTELHDDKGEFLRKTGAEYGTTTGRPRRCGWMDTVVGRYATRINGVTDFVITKLDVLTGLDKVPGLRRLRRGRRAPRRDAGQPDRLPPRDPDLRGARRLVGGHHRAAAPSRSCPPTRRPTCSGSRSSSAPGSRPSGSGRAATRSSSGSRSSRPSRTDAFAASPEHTAYESLCN